MYPGNHTWTRCTLDTLYLSIILLLPLPPHTEKPRRPHPPLPNPPARSGMATHLSTGFGRVEEFSQRWQQFRHGVTRPTTSCLGERLSACEIPRRCLQPSSSCVRPQWQTMHPPRRVMDALLTWALVASVVPMASNRGCTPQGCTIVPLGTFRLATVLGNSRAQRTARHNHGSPHHAQCHDREGRKDRVRLGLVHSSGCRSVRGETRSALTLARCRNAPGWIMQWMIFFSLARSIGLLCSASGSSTRLALQPPPRVPSLPCSSL